MISGTGQYPGGTLSQGQTLETEKEHLSVPYGRKWARNWCREAKRSGSAISKQET